MPVSLADYDIKARKAVKVFWGGRNAARKRQIKSGKQDQGERARVTAGKNMDGFVSLAADIVHANGLKHADIHLQRRVLMLPAISGRQKCGICWS